MKVKSSRQDSRQLTTEPEYPWIGAWKNTDDGPIESIVLFTGHNAGICLWAKPDSINTVGKYIDGGKGGAWAEASFEPYFGSVTLWSEP